MSLLETYIHAWHGTAHDVIALLPTLADDDWSKPTDLPGWSVHDVAAHLAHLEAVLAGHDDETSVRSTDGKVSPDYTQLGVDARADRPVWDIIEEFHAAVESRSRRLEADPPDPGAEAPRTPGGVGWTWEVLLRNRAIDAWSHEQDIRRAVDRPGSLDTAGAQVTTQSFAAGMPFVLGKRVAPPVGTSVVWRLTGEIPMDIGAVIGDDKRAAAEVVDDPTTTLTMSSETFAILASGRRRPEAVDVQVDGDAELGSSVLAAMTLTS